MKVSPGLLAIFVLWVIIFTADRTLRRIKKYSRRYRHFLEECGLSVSFCQIRWYTTSLNRLFLRLGRLWPGALKLWFTLGVVFGGISMVFSLVALLYMMYRTLEETNPEQILKPVMPGVNVPLQHLFHYFFSLSLAGMFHEVGHAVAAVREQVRVNGFGLFMMAIYPGAFVDLHPDHLQVISSLRQLRVFCAGVWHNFVIVLASLGCWCLLPHILFPLYVTGKGAVVTNVGQNCALKATLLPGDTVTAINDCPIRVIPDWLHCIKDTVDMTPTGYCGSLLSLPRTDSKTRNVTWVNGEPDCCTDNSSSRFCFSYTGFMGKQKYSCLPARSTLSNPSCQAAKDCPGLLNRICLKPLTSNKTRLLRIKHANGIPLIFVGDPWELYFSVALTGYTPKASILSLHFPEYLETFLLYMISLSGALAMLNIVPCYFLDGQWALHGFIEYFLVRTLPNKNLRLILYHIILAVGSFALVTNIVVALWSVGKS